TNMPREVTLPGSVLARLEPGDDGEPAPLQGGKAVLLPFENGQDDAGGERSRCDHQVRVGGEIGRHFHAVAPGSYAHAGAEFVRGEEHYRWVQQVGQRAGKLPHASGAQAAFDGDRDIVMGAESFEAKTAAIRRFPSVEFAAHKFDLLPKGPPSAHG